MVAKETKAFSTYTPEEIEKINAVQDHYGTKKVPQEVQDQLAKELKRSTRTLYWKLRDRRQENIEKQNNQSAVSLLTTNNKPSEPSGSDQFGSDSPKKELRIHFKTLRIEGNVLIIEF